MIVLAVAMFLRFTIPQRHPDSRTATGLFAASYDVIEDVECPEYARERIRELRQWFGENLIVPPCLKKGLYPRAVCWFRPSAEGHIAKMWELLWTLRGLDVRVQLHKAWDPGEVVYEDGVQVAAMVDRRRSGSRTWRERVIG